MNVKSPSRIDRFLERLKKYKIVIETIGFLALTIMGIVVSIFTYQIFAYQAAIMEWENRPVFQFQTNITDRDETLVISNQGGPLNNLYVEYGTFLHLYYVKNNIIYSVDLPIKDYFLTDISTANVVGTVRVLSDRDIKDYSNLIYGGYHYWLTQEYDEDFMGGNRRRVDRLLYDWVENSSYNYPEKYGGKYVIVRVLYMDIFSKSLEEYFLVNEDSASKLTYQEGKAWYTEYLTKKEDYGIDIWHQGMWSDRNRSYYTSPRYWNWTYYFEKVGTPTIEQEYLPMP